MTNPNYKDGQGAQALDQNQQTDRYEYVVVSGCDVTINSGTLGNSDTLSIASGEVVVGGTRHDIASQSVQVDDSNADPRKDVVYVDVNGGITVAKGTSESTKPSDQSRFDTYRPAPPDLSSTEATVLAEVWVPGGATSITSSDLRDRRTLGDIYAGEVEANGQSTVGERIEVWGRDGETYRQSYEATATGLQTAVDELPKTGGKILVPGKTIDFGASDFDLRSSNSNIRLSSPLTITGVGRGQPGNQDGTSTDNTSTRLKFDAGYGVTATEGNHNVYLGHMDLAGGGISSGSGILLDMTSGLGADLVAESVTFYGAHRGTKLAAAYNSTFRDCQFRDCARAVTNGQDFVNSITFDSCVWRGCGDSLGDYAIRFEDKGYYIGFDIYRPLGDINNYGFLYANGNGHVKIDGGRIERSNQAGGDHGIYFGDTLQAAYLRGGWQMSVTNNANQAHIYDAAGFTLVTAGNWGNSQNNTADYDWHVASGESTFITVLFDGDFLISQDAGPTPQVTWFMSDTSGTVVNNQDPSQFTRQSGNIFERLVLTDLYDNLGEAGSANVNLHLGALNWPTSETGVGDPAIQRNSITRMLMEAGQTTFGEQPLNIPDGGPADAGEISLENGRIYEDANGDIVVEDSAGNTNTLT